MWQEMEERQVVQGATWQSLKERFLRSICSRLDTFDLTAEARQQLLKDGPASATSSPPSSKSTFKTNVCSTSSTTTVNESATSTTVGAEGGTTSDGQPLAATMEPDVILTVASPVSICPVCLEKVNSKHMSRHKLQHENLLPPPCNLCGKQLGRKDSLARHLKDSCPRSGDFQIIFT